VPGRCGRRKHSIRCDPERVRPAFQLVQALLRLSVEPVSGGHQLAAQGAPHPRSQLAEALHRDRGRSKIVACIQRRGGHDPLVDQRAKRRGGINVACRSRSSRG